MKIIRRSVETHFTPLAMAIIFSIRAQNFYVTTKNNIQGDTDSK